MKRNTRLKELNITPSNIYGGVPIYMINDWFLVVSYFHKNALSYIIGSVFNTPLDTVDSFDNIAVR